MNKQIITSRHSRRHFIKYGSLAAGGAALTGPYLLRGQNLNSRLNIAQIGLGVKGMSDAQWCGTENLVAICEVNSTPMDHLKQYIPTAKTYKDFRELLDKEKTLDAVDIAVPDHSHAVIAATAIKLGKHVYCQKPLTHDVAEARLLRDLARQYKVATQMGNQGSASDGLRRAVEIVQGGIDRPGASTAYVWTNRPVWPQGRDAPPAPIPSRPILIGTSGSAPRPTGPTRRNGRTPDLATMSPNVLHFSPNVYQPFNWRGWHDFGTGAAGRHGLPHRQLALPRAQTRLSDGDRSHSAPG